MSDRKIPYTQVLLLLGVAACSSSPESIQIFVLTSDAAYPGWRASTPNDAGWTVVPMDAASGPADAGEDTALAIDAAFSTSDSGGPDVGPPAVPSTCDATVGLAVLSQGPIAAVNGANDLAILGEGFFALASGDASAFTRWGQFDIDSNENIVNNAGLGLLGYAVDDAGAAVGAPYPLVVPNVMPPHATTIFTLVANLSSTSSPPQQAFDVANPAGTSNFSTESTMFDPGGAAHTLSVCFSRVGDGADWGYDVLVAADPNVWGGSPTDPFTLVSSGTLSFDDTGSMNAMTGAPFLVQFAGASPQTITLDFGSPTSAGGTGLDGVTMFAAASQVNYQAQDGYPAGLLTDTWISSFGSGLGFSPTSGGDIWAEYTNAKGLFVGRVAIALFPAPEALTVVSSPNSYMLAATPSSGAPSLGGPGLANRGYVVAPSLEAQGFTSDPCP